MSLEQDVAAARTAVDEVERACARAAGHFRESIDARRLRLDVTHVRQDLDLLCGATPAAVRGRHHASAAWDDGMDGAGSLGRATR